jgi:galacturan 1,4-alpha-galacturonidase
MRAQSLALGVFSLSSAVLAVPERPALAAHPLSLTEPLPISPARDPAKVCYVPSGEANSSPSILAAAKKCNNGGTVVFPACGNYTIASPLDLTFLQNIDLAILGTIYIKDDVEYWQTRTFKYAYQGANLFWRIGGQDVNIFGLGHGVIDGELPLPFLFPFSPFPLFFFFFFLFDKTGCVE